MNAKIGHNETTVRLGLLAEDAKQAISKVAAGEETAIEGWIAYGAALNEGRRIFGEDDDYNFGKWKQTNVYSNLEESFALHPADEAAAMWAAREPVNFEATRAAHPRVRTVRGLHAKWKEIEAIRLREEARIAAEKARAEAERQADRERSARERSADADDEDQRREAEQEAEEAAAAKEQAEAQLADAEIKMPVDPADLHDGLREAMNENNRKSSNKNPVHWTCLEKMPGSMLV